MKRYELIVIGAGPAGLSAGIEAAKNGMKVAVVDENARDIRNDTSTKSSLRKWVFHRRFFAR